jgi:hypothetical protein
LWIGDSETLIAVLGLGLARFEITVQKEQPGARVLSCRIDPARIMQKEEREQNERRPCCYWNPSRTASRVV